jgi:hypothetical protein
LYCIILYSINICDTRVCPILSHRSSLRGEQAYYCHGRRFCTNSAPLPSPSKLIPDQFPKNNTKCHPPRRRFMYIVLPSQPHEHNSRHLRQLHTVLKPVEYRPAKEEKEGALYVQYCSPCHRILFNWREFPRRGREAHRHESSASTQLYSPKNHIQAPQ